jgi:hypothetical protein
MMPLNLKLLSLKKCHAIYIHFVFINNFERKTKTVEKEIYFYGLVIVFILIFISQLKFEITP